MAIEHKNIPEAGLHEPKGASTAASDRVYVSNGLGSGEWAKVDADTLQGTVNNSSEEGMRVVTDGAGGFRVEAPTGRSRAMMTLTNNAIVVPLAAATDSQLGTNSDYTILDLAFNFENVKGIVTGPNYLQLGESGVYMIDFWANAKAGNNNARLALKFVINDIEFINRRPKLRLPVAGEISNFSASGFHGFAQGDQVKLAIASNITTDITLEDLAFQMILLEGL